MDLTPEQLAEARREGWAPANGMVRIVYDGKNQPEFKNTMEILRFLLWRAKESPWHGEFFLSLPWTPGDDALTMEEGWRISLDGGIRIANFGKPIPFKTNEELHDHIRAGMEKGDPLYLKAARTVAKRKLINGGP